MSDCPSDIPVDVRLSGPTSLLESDTSPSILHFAFCILNPFSIPLGFKKVKLKSDRQMISYDFTVPYVFTNIEES